MGLLGEECVLNHGETLEFSQTTGDLVISR